ncbi:hypothetical protein AOLI_G00286770 [Acnodon oligacanthus]
MIEEKTDSPCEVIQKVFLLPKGLMLWSKRSTDIFHKWSKEDIVYLDATGSILKKKKKDSSGAFYIYELVVRNPSKSSPPLPVATYVTCDHTTALVLYFLISFQTDHARLHGHRNTKPVMVVCDGSTVLMQAISHVFCQT